MDQISKIAKLQAFRYDSNSLEPINPGQSTSINSRQSASIDSRQSKPSNVRVTKTGVRSKPTPTHLKDLPPIITTNQILMFIGFNPGVQSSIQQHHYAHPTNLFWKLFNQSGLFTKMVTNDDDDPFLNRVIVNNKSELRAQDDIHLVRYRIGMTDLVLRCTKSVDELTTLEKLENVPRLIEEFKYTLSQYLVFVGKGIWEIVVKYVVKKYDIKGCKLKGVFTWGKQVQEQHDGPYFDMLERLQNELDQREIYVFPSTSGLVTSMNFAEKLVLWDDLTRDVNENSGSTSSESTSSESTSSGSEAITERAPKA